MIVISTIPQAIEFESLILDIVRRNIILLCKEDKQLELPVVAGYVEDLSVFAIFTISSLQTTNIFQLLIAW